ncbi:unnamed protein product [Penicillium pancosmium]
MGCGKASPILCAIPRIDYAPGPTNKMKAARWMGTRDVEVGLVPKPMITDPNDAIVQITHCTICGSDIHLYEGELDDQMEKGDILGQEAIGVVEEVGPEVKSLKKGDRVNILPVVACGKFDYCMRGEYSLSDSAADIPVIRLTPRDIDARNILGLANVVTTAWHALELAEVQSGDVVGVWGCGPVGLSAQRLAKLRGAKKVYGMDQDPQRLKQAEDFGMISINIKEHPDVGDCILSIQPQGLDRAIEASGFRSPTKSPHTALRTMGLQRDSSDTVGSIIKATRKGGNVALVADLFFASHDFPIGLDAEGIDFAWRSVGTAEVTQYHPFLMVLVVQGKVDPSWMFTFEDELENIADHYQKFSQHKVPGGLKVCLVTAFVRSERLQSNSDMPVDQAESSGYSSGG